MNKYFLCKLGYSGSVIFPCLNSEVIGKAIERIELNKSPGLDGVSIEHIVHAHPSIILILLKLFSLVIHTGVTPSVFSL